MFEAPTIAQNQTTAPVENVTFDRYQVNNSSDVIRSGINYDERFKGMPTEARDTLLRNLGRINPEHPAYQSLISALNSAEN